MIVIVCFLLFAAAVTALFARFVSAGVGWLLPVFLLAFLLGHGLYVLFWWLLSLPVDRKKPIEKQNPRSLRACALTGRLLCLYGGIRPRLVGEEKLPKDRPFLLVSNHRSLFDPLTAIYLFRRCRLAFVSKPSNLAIPLVGDVMYAMGCLAIDRENDRAALKTILTAADYLKRGVCSMAIYPEGTRSRNGELLPFHAGSFKIAQRAGVPLVIACTQGTENMKQRLLRRGKPVTVTVLQVLPPETVKAMSTQELAALARSAIQNCLNGGEEEQEAAL